MSKDQILLVALNAKYIHSNPAVYSLAAYANEVSGNVSIAEFTINDRYEDVLRGILMRKPEVIGFSVYIWNAEFMKQLIEDIHNIVPQIRLLAGGPEATNDPETYLNWCELVMLGEGEKNFRQIRAEFNKVFRDLFGGGVADLQLVREEGQDLLDSGVSVIAQPPGKKLQNLMQLSGGEKALTAIALIFAIQNLKPSPFCLVDEIEAALDEPNVDRFANYLKRLKTNTQIIAITHRRGTMQAAETLYGITMQEKGVSIQVSVDLSDPQYND